MTLAKTTHSSPKGRLKRFIFILLFGTFTLTSCTKKMPSADDSFYPSKIKNYPKSQARLLYALLSPEEKQLEWLGHIRYGITQIGASSVQQEFVKGLLKNLEIDFFAKPLRDVEAKLLTLEARTKAIFPDKKQLIYLFGGLENSYAAFSAEYEDFFQEQQTPKCSCSTKSDRCPGMQSCQSEVVCTQTSGGCGLLWAFDCNSICQ